ncbi:hypothetical protein CLU97_3300 [Chryseobacterium sp. 7]|uniref:hypothetical protein n=1 Tax=Chryseobacterium sp. 7 TaxID=2035214 RepID=UPI000F1BBFFB|nr:hypothetical protein [Chryseobacterium sp. 7]RLJ33812.1 hypothetical protein CLU97_3300 [Chryseobacterium sp. 7]
MEKKTIQVDSNIPKSVLIGFLLAFLTIFAVQHFSTFSYIPNLGNPTIDYGHKVVISGTYDTRTTPVGALYQTTPFGTRINLPTNGMMCSELLYDSDFKSYSNKGVLYAKSVFTDYKYLLLFWLAYTLTVLFFKRYRLKVLILILPVLGMSCENKTVQEKASTKAIQADTAIQYTPPTVSLPDPETIQKRYSFVVFEGDSFFSHEGQKIVTTGIFETDAFLDKDKEYQLMDEAQQKAMINLELKNVEKRYIQTFDSYAEASKKRENLLGINQNTSNEEEHPYQQYIVIQHKAYFHQTPNQNTRKDTYLLYGAKIFVSNETQYFVYTTFTNTDGITSKGWILKTDIEIY